MALFAQMLMAQRAFIEKLQSMIITLSNGGLIQSENFQAGQSGFRIKSDGDAEFNNGKFRGHIEADSGKFRGHIEADSGEINNVTIEEQAVFLGTIKSGPVFISNETTNPVSPMIFNAGTQVRNVVDSLGRNKTINTSSGSYGSKSGLVAIITTYTAGSYNPVGANIPSVYKLKLVFNDGTNMEFTDTDSPTINTISQQLSIGGSVPGKIFRIDNLPTGSDGLPPGTVYRNGNQLCIV